MIINKLYTAVLQIFQDYESKVITKSLAYNSRTGALLSVRTVRICVPEKVEGKKIIIIMRYKLK